MQQKCPVSSLILEILEPIIAQEGQISPDTKNKVSSLASLSGQRSCDELQGLLGPLFDDHPRIFHLFYDQTHSKIFTFIDENDIRKLELIFTIGDYFFQKGISLKKINTKHQTPLCHAISHFRLEIASLLINKGADVNPPVEQLYLRSPICCAVNARSVAAINLLISHGLTKETLNGEPQKGTSPLYLAVKLDELEIVKLLVANGANLTPTRNGVIQGYTSDFNSPLRVALVNKNLVIAKFLFDLIKKDHGLFTETLPIFFRYAPLEILENYIEDLTLTLEVKFATQVVTRVKREVTLETEWSGKILLECLLSATDNPEQRLKIIAKLIQQLMQLEFLDPKVQAEPSFVERESIEKVAKEKDSYPIFCIASKLLSSIDSATKQGRGNVCLRVLKSAMISVESISSSPRFGAGIKFIEVILGRMVKDPETTYLDKDAIDILTQVQLKTISSTQRSMSTDARSCEEKVRFRAMAGGVAYSNITEVPLLSYRGSSYFVDALRTTFKILKKLDMLRSNWDVTRAQSLLVDIEDNATLNLSAEIMCSHLKVPEHIIPIVLFKKEDSWIYLLICRGFFEPNGAVQIEIPQSEFGRVFPLINRELNENRQRQDQSRDVFREIYYRIWRHLLFLEQLLNKRVAYVTTWLHQPYKFPTCFASNLKPVIDIIFSLALKEALPTEIMEKFFEVMRSKILVQIRKTNLCDETTLSSTLKGEPQSLPPMQLLYKYTTLLVRWREFYRYHPTHEEELEAKANSVEHVLEHTRIRLNTRINFFGMNGVSDSGLSTEPLLIKSP